MTREHQPAILQHFRFEHLPDHLAAVSAPVAELAHHLAATLPDGPELRAGLRKLLEAKDAFVRAATEGDNTSAAAASADPISK